MNNNTNFTILFILLAILCGFVMWYYHTIGLILMAGLLVLILVRLYQSRQTQSEVMTGIDRIYKRFNELNRNQMNQLPLAFVITDESGRIVWYNDAFADSFYPDSDSKPDIIGKKVGEELNLNLDECLNDPDFEYSNRNIDYNVSVQDLKDSRGNLHIINFYDVTLLKRQKEIYSKYESVFCYIMIDSYDDIIDTMPSHEKSSILSQIDLKLTDWANRKDAFILNYETDRYLVIFEREKLQIMERGRFHILDEIREIPNETHTPITLSIGIGVSDKPLTIQEADGISHSALEIALARGGDQAVVKKDESLKFYGGTTEATEKRTKVKARVKAFGLQELIHESDNVVIMGHKTPDMDCIGSAIGLADACRENGKNVKIVLSDINISIRALCEYLSDIGGYNDIFMKPREIESFIRPNTLMIVVDTQNGNYVEAPELLEQVSKTVVIDHHRRSGTAVEAILSYCEVYASSTCELVTELLQYFNGRDVISIPAANALMAGMFMDTKMFTVKTGVRTFEAASYLKRKGGDTVKARSMLQEDLTTYGLKAKAVQNAHIYHDCIAVSLFEDESEYAKIIAAQAADELLNIKGISASFIILSCSGVITISGRSTGDINVQLILEKLGGGGHLAMAGAQLETKSLDEANIMLLETINQYMEERQS
ncbi:MAG: DHH family phosphoesterase [Eubacteriaceae bacterium]|jgi:c-di-AMP phosphodiesterase-like protein